MRTIYCLLLLLCPYLSVAQSPVLKSIRPSDAVPDIVFNSLLNYNTNSAKLSDFKGKLVLLDFWATWCANCLKKFNLLDSMQRSHPARLQVLLVSGTGSRDSKKNIQAYFAKHRNAAGSPFAMPAAYNDSIAGKYFTHTGVPHYVWIDGSGKCIAITKSDEVTAANITAVLQGNLPAFSGLYLSDDFDFEKPIFINGNAGDGSGLLARSTLSNFIPGMPPVARYSRNADKLVTQYKLINQPLIELVKKAYDVTVKNERIVFRVTDSVKTILLPQVTSAASYAYELLCPPLAYAAALKLVQQDVQRYFNLQATWDSLPAPCYYLAVDTALIKPFVSSGGKSINRLYEAENKSLQNGKLSTLASYLSNTMQRPVLLAASLPVLVNITLPAGSDEAVSTALAKPGLVLTQVTAIIPQFVIYQTPKQNL